MIAPIFVLGPVVAARSLGGASAWGVIAAGFGLGAILGGAAALRFKPGRPILVGWLLLSLFGLPAALLAIPAPALVVAAGAVWAGIALNFANTLFETTLQQHVPPGAIARAMSFALTLALVLHPLGLAAVGPVSDAVGTRATLIGAAAWSVVASCIVLSARSVRQVRAITEDDAARAAAS